MFLPNPKFQSTLTVVEKKIFVPIKQKPEIFANSFFFEMKMKWWCHGGRFWVITTPASPMVGKAT